MASKQKKIFVVGGGTGGHLSPAIALGQELAKRNYKVYLITDERCKKYIPQNLNLSVKFIKSIGLKSGLLNKIKFIYIMAIGFIQALSLMIKIRPKIVVGFGGYTIFPTLLATRLTGATIILHEQNSFLGRANIFFAKYAKIIALTFDQTENIPSHAQNKLVVTGNPVRQEFNNSYIKHEYDDKEKFKIIVFGGSQGAKYFSSLIPNTLKFLSKLSPQLKIHITHQVHKYDYSRVKRAYKKLDIEFELAEYFHDLPRRYSENHLAICRSGSSTISELIMMQLPAIYIPYPYAANDHQLLNAQYIENHKAGWYFEQKFITPEILAGKITKLIVDNKILQQASIQLKNLQKNSSFILADTVEKYIYTS